MQNKKPNTATPMMQQYKKIKKELPKDALLFFRLGDFYELFFDDAKIGAELLELTLTHRQGIPMCGVPYHASENYISRLVRLGKRVAICDQMEAPRPGTIVKRGVTQVVTPGSVTDASMLDPKQNNFCAALVKHGDVHGVAYIDLSTGEFCAGETKSLDGAREMVERVGPSEVITPSHQKDLFRASGKTLSVGHDGWTFDDQSAEFTLQGHFKTQSLDGFGLRELPAARSAAGGLLHYVTTTLRRNLDHVRGITTLQRDDVLTVDSISARNLEIFKSLGEGRAQSSLCTAMDRSVTAGGGRMLRRWLLEPLRDPQKIRERQECVAFWKKEEGLRHTMREAFRRVRDLERLIARLSQGSGNGRDLVALRASLGELPAISQILSQVSPPLLLQLAQEIYPLPDLFNLLNTAINDEPPLNIKEGGIIKDAYRKELDELRAASFKGKEWLAELQIKEQERTGVKSLKVRYNQVFGYYIEISKANLKAVPEDYIRKQTMTNAERFITPALKEMESKILGAEERARQMEYELFLEVRGVVVSQMALIQKTAQSLSAIDVLIGWGELSQERDYCVPEILSDFTLEIEEGRHPVLEQMDLGEKFVPNDGNMGGEDCLLVVLTGPNMAGKSTYLRQMALISIMAHTGCFVPARSARVGILDRVFTRVGASDDISRGQSTFMVEMTETANILNHATKASLVILDEVGRGTSTFDGLSIAWSVAEHLHSVIACKTIFATHYHEMTELEKLFPRVKNYNVLVKEWNDELVFLRKIAEGGADQSYGIQVARLAGVPKSVLLRAKEILGNLEKSELNAHGKERKGKRPKSLGVKKTMQEDEEGLLDLFRSH